MNPETRYAETVDGVFIAYQVLGEGPWTIVLICSPFASNVELAWEWPFLADQYRRLSRLGRLVVFDRRWTADWRLHQALPTCASA